MKSRTVVCVVLAIFAAFAVAVTRNPPRPSIGIFSSPLADCPAPPADLENVKSCVFGTYVRWLEAAGARVVPMHWEAPLAEKVAMMEKLNGVLFAGGSLDVKPEYYHRFRDKVCELVNVSRRWNEEGDPFVLWGTCQGFQMLSACVAGSLDVVEDGYRGLAPRMLPLNLTAAGSASRLFSAADSTTLADLTTSDSTLNYHHEGVTPQTFEENAGLKEFFDVTSTNADLDGRAFVSTIEGKDAAVFGVQWHPEWPAFDWSNAIISKSDASIRVSQFVGRFLRDQLMANNHTFPSPESLEDVVIARHPTSYQGWGRERFWIGGQKKSTHDRAAAFIAIAVFAAAASFVAGAAASRALISRSLRRESLLNENAALENQDHLQ